MKPSRLWATLGTGFLLSIALAGCQASQSTSEQNAQTTPPANNNISATDSADSMASALRNPADSKTAAADKMAADKAAADKTATMTKTDPTTKKVSKTPAVQGIAITANGFSPASIAIAPGTKVIFSNLDDAKHWPASNNHPSHTLCPGFDALKPLGKNQTYEFTFTKAQVCTFHDHLNPSWIGTITIK